jgi:CHAT domain-containing protein
VLAGSESQVMSLWQVSDTATRDLMIAYYRRLRAGEGRADALRQVQLEMLRAGAARAHPFYWASFIESGDWRPAFESR